MNDENYWKQFMKSGRVEDYLTYACSREMPQKRNQISGEYPYAGSMFRDRAGAKPDSCR